VKETGEKFQITDRARALIAVAFASHAASAYEPEPVVIGPSEEVG
jgi:hypothetical protein